MNKLKLIALFFGGFFLSAAVTFPLWYGYAPLNLSFFLSGDGSPYIDIEYTYPKKGEKVLSLYPQLTAEPALQEVKIKSGIIDGMKMKIRHYSGTINISDMFLSGKNLQNLHILQNPDTNILNDSSNNQSFMMNNTAEIELCSDCFLQNHKVYKPITAIILLSVYLLLWGVVGIIYLLRDRIKAKIPEIASLNSYLRILPYAKPYWFRAMLSILITIPIGSMDAVVAWSLKPFMDVVLVEKQHGWTTYIPLMLVGLSIIQAILTYLATYMNTWVGNKIALDIKRQLFNKLIHSDATFFDKNDSGFVLYRFNHDAETACGGLLKSLRLFSTRFFSSVSLIFVLFYNSWQLAIVAVVVLFGALMPLTRLRKKLRKVIRKDINVMSAILAHLNETFGGNRIISSYNLLDFCRKKFRYIVEEMFSVTMQMTKKTGAVAPVMHVISSLGITVAIWFGSYLIVNHRITVGNFAAFVTSLIMLYNPLKSIGNSASGIIMSLLAVDRIFKILDEQPKIKNKENALALNECHGNILYKNVSFAYNRERKVLNNINLEIKSGQTIALVGNSGGGKTTISVLLPRFYDVTAGEILIDGTNIKNFDVESLRDNIAVVFQDNFLFNGTIRDNILFGRTDVSEEQLAQAIDASCLTDFISGLDNGLDTAIGERGALLSGGQKQRLAIARAFIKNAPILILDEATSALDNKSEKVVQQAIDNLMKDRTVLVIAHRLSTVRNADKIVVINNGEIAEMGTHDELINKEGAYAALYKAQLI